MKLSGMIKELQAIKAQHGDLEVSIENDDGDTRMCFPAYAASPAYVSAHYATYSSPKPPNAVVISTY